MRVERTGLLLAVKETWLYLLAKHAAPVAASAVWKYASLLSMMNSRTSQTQAFYPKVVPLQLPRLKLPFQKHQQLQEVDSGAISVNESNHCLEVHQKVLLLFRPLLLLLLYRYHLLNLPNQQRSLIQALCLVLMHLHRFLLA